LAGRKGDVHLKKTNKLSYESVNGKGRAYHILFMDLYKAYDSVHWRWIRLTMQHIGLPEWVMQIMEAMLKEVKITPFFGATVDVWINVKRGVRQGCPWSPLIFLIAYEPLLCRIKVAVPKVSRCAFADDLATGSFNLWDISIVMHVSDLFGLASGLLASIPKCILVSPRHVVMEYEVWLGTGTVPWCKVNGGGFAIKRAHKYLGLLMGQDVDTPAVFEDAARKMVSRIYSYGDSLKPLSMARRVLAWNVFVSTIPTYLVSFYLFPFTADGSACGLVAKAVRDVLIPWGGKGFKYCHLLATAKGVGCGPPLVDL
jgi:hypothetical protein